MISIILCTFIGGLISLKQDIETIVIGTFIGAAFGLFFAFIIGMMLAQTNEYKTDIETKNLISIVDRPTSTAQNYFLSSARTGERMTFFSYYEDVEGYKSHKSYDKNSIIRYSNDIPKLEIHSKISQKQKWYKYFGFIMYSTDNDTKYIYYIPEGGIQTEYYLDL